MQYIFRLGEAARVRALLWGGTLALAGCAAAALAPGGWPWPVWPGLGLSVLMPALWALWAVCGEPEPLLLPEQPLAPPGPSCRTAQIVALAALTAQG